MVDYPDSNVSRYAERQLRSKENIFGRRAAKYRRQEARAAKGIVNPTKSLFDKEKAANKHLDDKAVKEALGVLAQYACDGHEDLKDLQGTIKRSVDLQLSADDMEEHIQALESFQKKINYDDNINGLTKEESPVIGFYAKKKICQLIKAKIELWEKALRARGLREISDHVNQDPLRQRHRPRPSKKSTSSPRRDSAAHGAFMRAVEAQKTRVTFDRNELDRLARLLEGTKQGKPVHRSFKRPKNIVMFSDVATRRRMASNSMASSTPRPTSPPTSTSVPSSETAIPEASDPTSSFMPSSGASFRPNKKIPSPSEAYQLKQLLDHGTLPLKDQDRTLIKTLDRHYLKQEFEKAIYREDAEKVKFFDAVLTEKITFDPAIGDRYLDYFEQDIKNAIHEKKPLPVVNAYIERLEKTLLQYKKREDDPEVRAVLDKRFGTIFKKKAELDKASQVHAEKQHPDEASESALKEAKIAYQNALYDYLNGKLGIPLVGDKYKSLCEIISSLTPNAQSRVSTSPSSQKKEGEAAQPNAQAQASALPPSQEIIKKAIIARKVEVASGTDADQTKYVLTCNTTSRKATLLKQLQSLKSYLQQGTDKSLERPSQRTEKQYCYAMNSLIHATLAYKKEGLEDQWNEVVKEVTGNTPKALVKAFFRKKGKVNIPNYYMDNTKRLNAEGKAFAQILDQLDFGDVIPASEGRKHIGSRVGMQAKPQPKGMAAQTPRVTIFRKREESVKEATKGDEASPEGPPSEGDNNRQQVINLKEISLTRATSIDIGQGSRSGTISLPLFKKLWGRGHTTLEDAISHLKQGTLNKNLSSRRQGKISKLSCQAINSLLFEWSKNPNLGAQKIDNKETIEHMLLASFKTGDSDLYDIPDYYMKRAASYGEKNRAELTDKGQAALKLLKDIQDPTEHIQDLIYLFEHKIKLGHVENIREDRQELEAKTVSKVSTAEPKEASEAGSAI